jgi:hypothetical protein
MNDDEREDWLDRALEYSEAPLDDAGFTERVLRALPPPRRTSRLRVPILFGSTALAAGIAFFGAGGGEFLLRAVAQAVRFGDAPGGASLPVTGLAVIAAALAGAVALLRQEFERP